MIRLGGTVNCTVDWGDSTSDSYTTTGDKTHTYASDGTYTIQITGTLTAFGTTNPLTNRPKWLSCTSFGNLGVIDFTGAFAGATNLTIAPTALPATVATINSMFQGATSFNGDISGWNVAAVGGMVNTFLNATSFNGSLGGWNVANCTTFNGMFNGATAFQGGGIANWDISGLVAPGGLNNFATGCTFTTPNYDAVLIAWEANKASYRSDLSPNFGNSKYSAGAAAAARAALVTYGWTITDGGAA